MTHKELVAFIASEIGISKAGAGHFYKALVAKLHTELKRDGGLHLEGLVRLQLKPTKAREVRNPRTNEKFIKPAGTRLAIKATKALKDAVKD